MNFGDNQMRRRSAFCDTQKSNTGALRWRVSSAIAFTKMEFTSRGRILALIGLRLKRCQRQQFGTISQSAHVSRSLLALASWRLGGESSPVLEADGEAHYMRGGKPGYYPTFNELYHPVPLNLWDPFGFTEGQTEEQKARRLFAEINNGRLAMIGLFSLLLASKSDEAVPILNGLIKKYDGDVMQPFTPGFSFESLGA